MKHDARLHAAIAEGHPEWAELPATVAEARARPDTDTRQTYFTFSGKPCSRGHIAPRIQPGANCAECDKVYSRATDWRQKRASPPWLSQEQRQAISQIFDDAASRAEPHHVDHRVPLKHKHVCGLHVPWNLQVLPAADNCSKSNSFDYTNENDSWRTK